MGKSTEIPRGNPWEVHGKSLGGKCLRNQWEIPENLGGFEEEIWEIPEVNGHRSN